MKKKYEGQKAYWSPDTFENSLQAWVVFYRYAKLPFIPYLQEIE